MFKTSFTLIGKVQLTHDVFELTYSASELMRELPKPGQYVLFQLAPGLNRAYSLASFTESTFTLIIKRVPDGKGSPLICDAEVGSEFYGMIPLGHFTLKDNSHNKCFIGTGTGFAPLYCQLLALKSFSEIVQSLSFIFGVRNFADSFYVREIESFGEKFQNFQYVQYFSRESEFDSELTTHNSRTGYVTDWITLENIQPYDEFYICGSPAMVKSAREKLEALSVPKESVFFEQF
jgi:ferredoxin-NADP reductase